MGTWSGSHVHKGVDWETVTGKLKRLHSGGLGFIRRRVKESGWILGHCRNRALEARDEQRRR